MSGDLREAMLEMMVVLCTSINTVNATADELVRAADLTQGQPVSEALRGSARQQRVKVLEMEGQLAALEITFTEWFGA